MNPSLSQRTCEFCDSPPTRILYEIDSHQIVLCKRCGIAYVANPPEIADLREGYDDFFETGDGRDRPRYLERRKSKEKSARRRIKWIEQWIEPGRLLDIGCAAGFFLNVARKRGWDVHGVEFSTVAARYARETLELKNVRCGPIESISFEPASFDLITIWACIEHVTQPRRAVDNALKWLAPGGLLALNTGNWRSPSARIQGKNWRLMTPPSHLFFFSRSFFERHFRDRGLEIVAYRTNNFFSARRLWRHKRVRRVIERLNLGDIMTFVVRKPA